MCVSYGISLCLCEIWIYLFGLFTFVKIPDNNNSRYDKSFDSFVEAIHNPPYLASVWERWGYPNCFLMVIGLCFWLKLWPKHKKIFLCYDQSLRHSLAAWRVTTEDFLLKISIYVVSQHWKWSGCGISTIFRTVHCTMCYLLVYFKNDIKGLFWTAVFPDPF